MLRLIPNDGELVVYKALYETEFGPNSLWVRPRKMFEEQVIVDGKAVGRFQFVDENEKIKKFIEKPQTPISNLAIVGIYYFANGLKLKNALNTLLDQDIKTNNEYRLTDALQLMLESGEEFKTFPVSGWYDCGKKETMLATNQFLLEKYNYKYKIENTVVIDPCYISNTAKVTNSVIGPFASIAEGAVVTNSIIENTIISENANVSQISLTQSIIGDNAMVEGKAIELNLGSNSEIII